MKLIRILVVLPCTSIALFLSHSKAQEQTPTFLVKPARCISMHAGQICYQRLKFEWQTPDTDEYCLYQLAEGNLEPQEILCWQGNTLQSYELNFESNSNIRYQLRAKGSTILLGEIEVEVAWVYKSRTNYNKWRMF